MGSSYTKLSLVEKVDERRNPNTSKRTDEVFLLFSEAMMMNSIQIVNVMKGKARAHLQIIDVTGGRSLHEQVFVLSESKSEDSIGDWHELSEEIRIKHKSTICIRVEIEGDPTYTYSETVGVLSISGGPVVNVFRDPTEITIMNPLTKERTMTFELCQKHDTNLVMGMSIKQVRGRTCYL